MKIITIIGARPQFIKASIVSKALLHYPEIKEVVVHTGQHFDANMSEVFFEELQIPKPKYNLNIHSLNHGAMTGKMMEGIETILLKEKPDFVMIYGDTNSTLAGALAAKKLHIKVAHVEAGLRSFNMKMPEEINRILTDRVSDLLFCPTGTSVTNLLNEGAANWNATIVKNGDVMFDAALFYGELASKKSSIINTLQLHKFVLSTLHRAENTDNIEFLKEIFSALNHINSVQKVVMPMHPRTRAIVKSHHLKCDFQIIEPVGYLDMIQLVKNCSLVMTDSGGLQKEAFFFKKHCVTLREQTEWTELVENGFNSLCSPNYKSIYDSYEKMSTAVSDFEIELYGNGHASSVIAEEFSKLL